MRGTVAKRLMKEARKEAVGKAAGSAMPIYKAKKKAYKPNKKQQALHPYQKIN